MTGFQHLPLFQASQKHKDMGMLWKDLMWFNTWMHGGTDQCSCIHLTTFKL